MRDISRIRRQIKAAARHHAKELTMNTRIRFACAPLLALAVTGVALAAPDEDKLGRQRG